jgi:hypothetical protein
MATATRWARRTVAVGVVALPVWQAAVLLGGPRATTLTLGLLGFVLHVALGKAFALVPSYFARELAAPRAVAVHLPLTAGGTALLALGWLAGTPAWLRVVGAAAWATGLAVALGLLAWTLRTNPTGAETGTSEANAARAPLDRFANAFVPVVGVYLAVGAYALLAGVTPLPVLVDGNPARAHHLLAAGGAALLVLAVGARLLPRFLVVRAPRGLFAAALPAGAAGPALLAAGLPAGPTFRLGAAAEAVAILAFAAGYVVCHARSDRRRVALVGPLLGCLAGGVGVALGVSFAFLGLDVALVVAHRRLNLLGFLGLTVVGLTFQFYPPSVGSLPGSSDRGAAAVLGLLAAGLGVEVTGLALAVPAVTDLGRALGLVGAGWYAVLLLALFAER